MINRIYISFLFFILPIIYFAQEDTLLELGDNNILNASYNQFSLSSSKQKQNNKAILTLPFIDDFSQHYQYQDGDKWIVNNQVYINASFPINPPTYGVATFDGLKANGKPYDFTSPNSYGIADTLTSQKIDISTVIDSVFLSFYYQPQGNGNAPEARDSLKLEFFRLSDSSWVRIWAVPGTTNQPFNKVMIPVDNTFHNNAFQFRFLNYATLSGNVDHWNLDYVYLNDNRNHADTALNDVSFITNNFNLLKGYSAMPWQHYLTDTIGLMDSVMNVDYKNNHNTTYSVFYKYQVISDNGSGSVIETYPSTTSSKFANAFSSLTEPQAVYKVAPFLNDFTFPSDFSAPTKVFQIKNFFDLGGSTVDSLIKNDTVLSYQVFGSYYAYDDGSAEVGYGVQGVGSKLAHEFTIRKTDTLTAFQIYFSPIRDDLTAKTFRLKVWSSLSPEVEIYSQPATLFTNPIYSNTNEFLNYTLDIPLYLDSGTYYFGWEKISAEFLNVGFDVNNNMKSKIYFNANGFWESGSFDGSLMLRPVFGNFPDPQVGIEEIKNNDDFNVYPNPANEFIYFEKIKALNNDIFSVDLIDLSGKTITSTTTSLSNNLNVNNISNGIYFIRFVNLNTHQIVTKKIIISK